MTALTEVMWRKKKHIKFVRISQETRIVTLKRTVVTGRTGGTSFDFNIREWMKQKNFNYRDISVWNGTMN